MKKIFSTLIIVFLIYPISIFAQQDSIPNPDFELWTDYLNPVPYAVPQDWNTMDSIIVTFNNYSTVEKDTSAYTGNYCARLTTKTINIPFVGNIDVPGLMTLGKIKLIPLSVGGGIPDTSKPHHLKGYYKYSPVNNDSCFIMACLTHFIPYKGKHDTIARAIFKGGAASSWTEFIAPFNYRPSSYEPDSLNIIVLSSADTSKLNVGSILWIDNLSLEMSSGILVDSRPILNAKLYPNPAKDFINLELEEAVENAELVVYNTNGSEVFKKNCCFGRKYSINTKSLDTGTYYFHLMLGNQRISSGSFIVSK